MKKLKNEESQGGGVTETKRKRACQYLFTFSVLHHNGGILEEGDEKVTSLQVWIQRQFRVVHHYTANVHK